MRDSVNIVEVITWNGMALEFVSLSARSMLIIIDYGESHYVGPIDGAQPNSQAWVDGFDHQGWLQLTSYYAQAFKTGSYPTVAQDTVVLWARPHPKNAVAPDSVPRPTGYDLVSFLYSYLFQSHQWLRRMTTSGLLCLPRNLRRSSFTRPRLVVTLSARAKLSTYQQA
jgi:glucan endo-1,3-alpha-glucosidase